MTDDRIDGQLNWFIRVVALGARIVGRAFARIRHEGFDRLPATGPLILAPNHISNADGVAVGAWLTPALRRRIHWLGKREMFRFPPIAAMLRYGGVHRLDRGAADVEAFRLALRVLEAGGVLLVFPEGTRSPDGRLQPLRDGVATLAIRSGALIVPIGVSGTDRVWPRSRLPRPGGRVVVRVGEPFRAADVVPGGADRRAAKAAVTEALARRIEALVEPRHRRSRTPST